MGNLHVTGNQSASGSGPRLIFGTDGSCLRNPDGPTGWAYICQNGVYALGGTPSGTNQIGELMAILTVLQDFPGEPMEIQSDSAYAIGCAATWKVGWQRAGYVRKAGPIANLTIIRRIHELIDARTSPVSFVKVKAHLSDETVHPLNVRADVLAGRGARAAQASRREVTETGSWPFPTDTVPEPGDPPRPADRVRRGVAATRRSPAAEPAPATVADRFLF